MGSVAYGRVKTAISTFISSSIFAENFSSRVSSVVEREGIHQPTQTRRRGFDVACEDGSRFTVIAEWDPKTNGGMWWFKVLSTEESCQVLVSTGNSSEGTPLLDLLYQYQGGLCGMCRQSADLVLDHDHVTDLVRGYLCRRCNAWEGASDYPWVQDYRENPPARKVGLRLSYKEARLSKD